MHRKACSSRRVQNVARYWATAYDWRKCEAKLNAPPQYITEIDGLGVGAVPPVPGGSGTVHAQNAHSPTSITAQSQHPSSA